MSGVILTGFLFALPANELAIPVILMLLTQQSVLGDAQGLRLRHFWLPVESQRKLRCVV